jgi:hypothetical protein
VRADHDSRRCTLDQQLDRGQRRTDPRVVGDGPVLERHVQIGAQEDALAADLSVSN